jgi:hypothetical protein
MEMLRKCHFLPYKFPEGQANLDCDFVAENALVENSALNLVAVEEELKTRREVSQSCAKPRASTVSREQRNKIDARGA